MRITNTTKETILADNCKIADTFFTRFMGLMGKDGLSKRSGLLITPCNSIHMFFMKFPLDVVFIDTNYKVVHLEENIVPWRVSKIIWESASVIELPIGTIKESRTEIGDILYL